MKKIDMLNDYIERCTEIINAKDAMSAKELQSKIIGVFISEIPSIKSQLSNYKFTFSENGPDFVNDLILLRAKLENYKINLVEKDEIEKSKQLQPIYAPVFNNQNNITASANASTTTTIELLFEQTIKDISNLDEQLSGEEKEELEDRISAIEVATKSNDKSKVLSKIGNVLKYVADKGIEVGIAVLPYLGEVSKYVSTL